MDGLLRLMIMPKEDYMQVLELQHEQVSYKKQDGTEAKFVRFYVSVNGIKLEVKPSDNTVRQVLHQYYGIE